MSGDAPSAARAASKSSMRSCSLRSSAWSFCLISSRRATRSWTKRTATRRVLCLLALPRFRRLLRGPSELLLLPRPRDGTTALDQEGDKDSTGGSIARSRKCLR